MELDDWAIIIQTISVVIAMVASIVSWRVATITAKQYKLNQEIHESRTQPKFKINNLYSNKTKIVLWIENVGYPSYYLSNIYSSNDKIEVVDSSEPATADKKNEGNKIIINVELNNGITEKSVIFLEGTDANGIEFCFKTPVLIIEEGVLKNQDKLKKQYFIKK